VTGPNVDPAQGEVQRFGAITDVMIVLQTEA